MAKEARALGVRVRFVGDDPRLVVSHEVVMAIHWRGVELGGARTSCGNSHIEPDRTECDHSYKCQRECSELRSALTSPGTKHASSLPRRLGLASGSARRIGDRGHSARQSDTLYVAALGTGLRRASSPPFGGRTWISSAASCTSGIRSSDSRGSGADQDGAIPPHLAPPLERYGPPGGSQGATDRRPRLRARVLYRSREPLHSVNVTRSLHRALTRLGLPQRRFHDLRHTFATLAIEAGEDLAVVSRALGHASVAITADTYIARHAGDAGATRRADGVSARRMNRPLPRASGGVSQRFLTTTGVSVPRRKQA